MTAPDAVADWQAGPEARYRSYYAPMAEVEAAPSQQEYARMVALKLMFGKKALAARGKSRQLSLF